MINIRVHAGLPGFIGRFVQPNEINDYSIRVIKRDFDDPEKRHAVLQHVYQSITGGF